MKNKTKGQMEAEISEAVEKILGVKVRSLHTDISTITGERVILFTLVSAPIIVRDRN